ncbi:MAG: hypothetical protein MUC37_14105 [Hyphomicrobium sp.]|jgi:hypothetical protein|nr:hypothetical protein [Hyphomicrobium sp.]
MTKNDERLTHAQAAAAARAQRLAEELRANLRKRKEKARAESTDHDSVSPAVSSGKRDR